MDSLARPRGPVRIRGPHFESQRLRLLFERCSARISAKIPIILAVFRGFHQNEISKTEKIMFYDIYAFIAKKNK
jgi:hypothetical protein